MTTRQYTGWRKSARSDGGNCVEVARAGDGTVGVRDSKDVAGPVLELCPDSWSAFTEDVRAGNLER